MKISFIIANYNGRSLLADCLDSVYASQGEFDKEVVVVDDASSDDSRSLVNACKDSSSTNSHPENLYPGLVWIQNETNAGYAATTNRGAAAATGDYLFLLNNDVRLYPDAAEKLSAFLESNELAGAAAPLLYYPDGRLQISCRRFPTPSALILEKLRINSLGRLRRWKLLPEEHTAGGVVAQPMASAFIIKRRCWEEVGPLDEGFPIFFNDVDWCYRFYSHTGHTIHLLTDAGAVHHEGATVNRMGYKKKIVFYKGLLRFYVKHFPLK
jgi:hypothetical protein